MFKLIEGAHPAHESREEWYGAYGAHLSTERCGDVTVQAVEYDWLDHEADDDIVERLCYELSGLGEAEARGLVSLARRVRAGAEEVVAHLEAAALAYGEGDVDRVVASLEAASAAEIHHGGDDPAAAALRAALLEEVEPPDFEDVEAGLAPGVYPAQLLSPPSGEDCTHLLVRADGSLGWCDANGEQSEDHHGNVSRFSANDLCDSGA